MVIVPYAGSCPSFTSLRLPISQADSPARFPAVQRSTSQQDNSAGSSKAYLWWLQTPLQMLVTVHRDSQGPGAPFHSRRHPGTGGGRQTGEGRQLFEPLTVVV